MKTALKEVRIFATRDTATSLLKKLGVRVADYNKFIKKIGDRKFECDVVAAEKHLTATTYGVQVMEIAEAPTSRIPSCLPKRVTTASTARALIEAGKTNDEVWAVIKKEFNLDDSKKYYPSWYRCAMRREARAASAAHFKGV